jgi:hypothetical protein
MPALGRMILSSIFLPPDDYILYRYDIILISHKQEKTGVSCFLKITCFFLQAQPGQYQAWDDKRL